MKSGEIIEYIEHRKVVCGVILRIDKTKIKILAESGREIKLSIDRIYHKSKTNLNLLSGKTQLLESIKQIVLIRNKIANFINVEGLWKQLNESPTWIEIESIVKLCFPEQPTENEKAAVLRAFFKNNMYFKFKPVQFFPNSKRKVNELSIAKKQAEHHKKLITTGSSWIQAVLNNSLANEINENNFELKNILCSFYILGKTSPYCKIAKKVLANTDINSNEELFNFIVKLGIWDIDENIDILRLKIPTKFSNKVIKKAISLQNGSYYKPNLDRRIDFTNRFTITIDGEDTLDFDDAISIEQENNNYLIGIHISDVANYVKKEDVIDKAARDRICSVYMPDIKIPMIPSHLSENICSLKKGQIRPAISTIVKLHPNGRVLDYNIYPSLVRVDEQLSYRKADKAIKDCEKITLLYNIAKKLRELRIKNGATQITLPEINIILEKSRRTRPIVKKIERESPSRILIAEMMILANWLTAQFLKKHKTPAIFRSQPDPRIRTTKNHQDSLFDNWMQKKMLRRMSLSKYAERHCILGLNAYVTATSPIRKYSDLVTQRQLLKALNIDRGYTNNEINMIIQTIANNTAQISKLQLARNRYWLLKYLEGEIGQTKEAIVLQKKRSSYSILIKLYVIECDIPQSNGIDLKPKDHVQVRIQHVSARNNVISVFMV